MPSINITEIDRTTPGIGDYSNFAVVIPGLVASDKISAFSQAADDNGIYEVSSQADFVENVGKVAPLLKSERIFATAEVFEDKKSTEQGETDLLKKLGIKVKLSGEQFYATFADQIYTAAAVESVSEEEGRLFLRITTGSEDAPNISYFKLTKVTGEYNKDTFYVVVLKGNEGQDKDTTSTAIQHYGNQMAFELLGLGYPVLYKQITQISDLTQPEFWEPLKDKSSYDFRFLSTGMLNGDNCVAASNRIIALAEARGDCLALVDVNADIYTPAEIISSSSKVIAAISKGANQITASKYAAIFAPALCYNTLQDTTYQNTMFPAHFHYLACFAQMLSSGYSEWYAAAGLTRGVSGYSIAGTEVKLGEVAEHALEPRFQTSYVDPSSGIATTLTRAINIIEKIRNGYFLYGNRTAQTLSGEGGEDLKASHFLNIRQACITLNKAIYNACRRLTFNPNGELLWIDFCNAIRPTLETMKSDQGIADYQIVRIATGQKAKLKARVRIVPIEAVEDFDIEISLENSLGETSVTVSE